MRATEQHWRIFATALACVFIVVVAAQFEVLVLVVVPAAAAGIYTRSQSPSRFYDGVGDAVGGVSAVPCSVRVFRVGRVCICVGARARVCLCNERFACPWGYSFLAISCVCLCVVSVRVSLIICSILMIMHSVILFYSFTSKTRKQNITL